MLLKIKYLARFLWYAITPLKASKQKDQEQKKKLTSLDAFLSFKFSLKKKFFSLQVYKIYAFRSYLLGCILVYHHL